MEKLGKRFEQIIGTTIVVNALTLGAQTYSDARWLAAVNAFCLGVFVIELCIRVAVDRRNFLRSGWNIYDAAVILASFIPGVGALSQLARLARVARLVRYLPEARVLLRGAVRAIPALGSLFTLTALLIFLYGMVAVELFGQVMPDHFGNIGLAALTLFILLSLENLPDIIYGGLEETPWAAPFFISYALLASFIVFNLIIGIVINALEQTRENHKQEAADLP